MAEEPRPVKPSEAYALGALHSIFMQVDGIEIDYTDGIDVTSRSLDVIGLVPANRMGNSPIMRITIEEV